MIVVYFVCCHSAANQWSHRHAYFIWILVKASDMIALFPPELSAVGVRRSEDPAVFLSHGTVQAPPRRTHDASCGGGTSRSNGPLSPLWRAGRILVTLLPV